MMALLILSSLMNSGLAPIEETRSASPVYWSVAPGEIAHDGREGSPFALAIAKVLEQQAKQPFNTLPELLAAVQATREDRGDANAWYEGPVDAAPLCPSQGVLRVHLVIQAGYERVSPLYGAEKKVLPGAFRGSCSDVELTLHSDLKGQAWPELVGTLRRDAEKTEGRTLIYLSGYGAQISGRNVLYGIDFDRRTAESASALSLDIGRLAQEIGEACANRCSLWVDTSRDAQIPESGER